MPYLGAPPFGGGVGVGGRWGTLQGRGGKFPAAAPAPSRFHVGPWSCPKSPQRLTCCGSVLEPRGPPYGRPPRLSRMGRIAIAIHHPSLLGIIKVVALQPHVNMQSHVAIWLKGAGLDFAPTHRSPD